MSHEYARREIMVHSQLNHPNIIKLYDYAETLYRYLLWLEYAGQYAEYFLQRVV